MTVQGNAKWLAAIIIIACFVVFFPVTDSTAGSSNSKKLYIHSIQADGVSQKLSNRIREGVYLSILNTYGSRYHIVDDEAIKVMYSQAEKILASGCSDESCIIQIAEGINADEIIYGSATRINNKIQLVMKNLYRRDVNLGTKSMVRISFLESQLDHYAEEIGKKLVNPKYRINRNAPATGDNLTAIREEKVGNLDIAVLKFTTNDDVINQMLEYLKGEVKKGDAYFEAGNYKLALTQYAIVKERIDTKLVKSQQRKMRKFTAGIVDRMVSTCVMISKEHELKGNTAYHEFRFAEAISEYTKARNQVERFKQRKDCAGILKRMKEKIRMTRTTGERHLANRVKSKLNLAIYHNIRDEKDKIRQAMDDAYELVTNSMFVTNDVKDEFNRFARVTKYEKTFAIIPENPRHGQTITIGGIEFVYIKGGTFWMGSRKSDPHARKDEFPRHKVKVDGFWMGKYEITEKQFKSIMNYSSKEYSIGDNYPVRNVDWNESIEFCNKLSNNFALTKQKFRLPYEAEWEYACRAGGNTIFHWGNKVNTNYFICDALKNEPYEARIIGSKKPNRWGLYNMCSNVSEWCMDWYDSNYYAHSPNINPTGPESGDNKVMRGGSWFTTDMLRIDEFPNMFYEIRSASRSHRESDYANFEQGFRVVLSIINE